MERDAWGIYHAADLAEKLLGRPSVTFEKDMSYYRGKRVLVTGAGGFIGSELCRQIAAAEPACLVMMDIGENGLYETEQALVMQYGGKLALYSEIASIRDRARLLCLFEHYRPEVVLHAAAHKHVPLMEHSDREAVKNNVFGTVNVMDACERFGVRKFVLVSSDKAVRPSSVMGAAKRICEMLVRSRSDSETAFVAVRLGNVLGSSGSVVPLFCRQIAAGGPVTVTDRRMVRYFMTVSEACGLILCAGSYAGRGEVYVLDMGQPLRVLGVAESVIRACGYEPYTDIEIKETGLRPGEKLCEELLVSPEQVEKTVNEKIFIEHGERLTREKVQADLALLEQVLHKTEGVFDTDEIKLALRQVVPSYHCEDIALD